MGFRPRCSPAVQQSAKVHGKWHASVAAIHAWDDKRWDELSERHVQLARDVGALSELPLALRRIVALGELPSLSTRGPCFRPRRYLTRFTGILPASEGDI